MRVAIITVLLVVPMVLFADPEPVQLLTWDQPASARIAPYALLDRDSARSSATAAWSAVLATRAPTVLALDAQRLLAVWTGPSGSWYAVLALHDGRLHELASGSWPEDWAARGAADFDGDGRADVLMVRTRGEGNGHSYDVQVAIAKPEGGFAFDGTVTQVLAGKRGAYFGVGDVDGDGTPDLVYHGYETGADYDTQLHLLRGVGAGRLAPIETATRILTSPHAATSPVLGDFDGDGDLDVFLPPDDDVADCGQCHVAINAGSGRFGAPVPSIDVCESNERPSGDEVMADGIAADLDGDGRLDLLMVVFDISEGAFRVDVHRGLGAGRFDDHPRTLVAGSTADPPTSIGWLRPMAAPPTPITPSPLDAAWGALGSARADEAAPAIGALGAAGAQAIPWIERQLSSAAGVDPTRVAALIEDLDSPEYTTRENGSIALAALGDRVEAPLRAALAANPSLEVKVRIERILKVIAARPADAAASDDDRRLIRVLAVLESRADPASSDLIARLATTGPTPLTRRTARLVRDRLASSK